MHVCLVSDDFLPNIGGISQHVYELAICYAKQGHDVTVVNQVMQPRAEKSEDLNGIRVIRTSAAWPIPKARIVPYSIKLRRVLLQLHQRHPIDVLHWHDLVAGFAIRSLPFGGRTVFTNHSSNFLMRRNSRLFRPLYRASLQHADRLVAPSQELANETQKLLQRDVIYIPNGFDPARFRPTPCQDLRSELGILPAENVLLAPRRLAPKNGVYVLAQALPIVLRSHPDTRLVITGGGFPQERQRIESFAVQHGCRKQILLLDGVENRRMPDHYSLADLVIMPSLMEAVSLSALEAMGCQRCVVASDVGGLSQLFRGGAWGKLVPPGDPVMLADAIIALLSDRAQRSALAAEARKHVLENYTWQQIAERTLAAYDVADLANTSTQAA